MPEVALNLPRLYAFLTELKFNNEKAWFDAHRSEYVALREEFVALMDGVIAGLAQTEPEVAPVRARDTLFRINRDVRFGHDKSPYKATFSAAISPGGRHSGLPLYYLQLGPDEAFVAGGVYAPAPADLAAVRGYVERFPARAEALMADPLLLAEFGGLSGEGLLKRFPRGFEPVSELLRYRRFTVSSPLDAAAGAELSGQVVRKCAAMRPLHAWLREALAYRRP